MNMRESSRTLKLFQTEALRPHRLVWPRTPAFQAGNTGSNPVGDTIIVERRGSFRLRLGGGAVVRMRVYSGMELCHDRFIM